MLNLDAIRRARSRIQASILVSPCPRSETFSAMSGSEVFLKLENLQRTGSDKERGALHRVLTLNPEERRRELIAASAGNHAQAVAYHARKLGLRAEICMPLATPLTKDGYSGIGTEGATKAMTREDLVGFWKGSFPRMHLSWLRATSAKANSGNSRKNTSAAGRGE
jgi:threonine dehydratase